MINNTPVQLPLEFTTNNYTFNNFIADNDNSRLALNLIKNSIHSEQYNLIYIWSTTRSVRSTGKGNSLLRSRKFSFLSYLCIHGITEWFLDIISCINFIYIILSLFTFKISDIIKRSSLTYPIQ